MPLFHNEKEISTFQTNGKTIHYAYINGKLVFVADLNKLIFRLATSTSNELVELDISNPNNYKIDWGDGTITTNTNSHTYAVADTYNIKVGFGTPTDIYGLSFERENRLLEIVQWGNGSFRNTESETFRNVGSLVISATDLPTIFTTTRAMFELTSLGEENSLNNWDMSQVISIEKMFAQSNFNGDLEGWDNQLDNVENCVETFFQSNFNKPISWKLPNVINLTGMFFRSYVFDQNLSGFEINTVNPVAGANMFNDARAFRGLGLENWDKVKWSSIFAMFNKTRKFNADISKWDVSRCTDFSFLFSTSRIFNCGNAPEGLRDWNTGNVTNMQSCFAGSPYNKPLNWNTIKATNMKSMFSGAGNFNQYIGTWNTANVTRMDLMFRGANSFNQNLQLWNVSKVSNFKCMFQNASSFNQYIGSWQINTTRRVRMDKMFEGAISFQQDISSWNFTMVNNLRGFMAGCNYHHSWYDLLLQKWATDLDFSKFSNPTIGMGNSKFTTIGKPFRDNLIAKGFVIEDGGLI